MKQTLLPAETLVVRAVFSTAVMDFHSPVGFTESIQLVCEAEARRVAEKHGDATV